MKGFDWEEFKRGGIMIHCAEEEIADDFLKQASEHGIKWRGGEPLSSSNRYMVYEEETCYGFHNFGGLVYGCIVYYRNGGYDIIEWEPEENK